jgi:hypothetical protein
MSEKPVKIARDNTIYYIVALTLLVFLFSFPLFQSETTDNSDVLPHIKFVQKSIDSGSWFSYTIFQPIIYILSAGSPKMSDWIFVTVFFLSFLVAIKSLITFYILKDDGLDNNRSFLIACALMFITPIINWWSYWNRIYLGQISATIWHNPTTILNIPFAILLFYFSMKALKSFKIKPFILVSLLIFLCGITKPNYLLAFIPVFFVIICYHFFIKKRDALISKKEFITILAIIFIPFLLLSFYQYISLNKGSSSFGIIIAPLRVWSLYTPSILMSLLLSLAFPISFTLVYFHQIRNNPKVIFSWLVLIVALFQMALFAQAGPGFGDGNFFWGSYIALFILFLTCISCFIKQPINKKWVFVMIIFLLHVISGLIYYFKILMGFGYY